MNLLDPRTRAIRFLRALSGEIPDAGTGAMTNEIDRGQCKAAADELERDDARVERSPDIVLTGGNHLANVLVHSLGPGFSEHFPPTMASEAVLEALGACDTYDVWCCWAAIMRWRDGVLRRIDEGTITEVAPIKQEAWDALAGSASNERFQSRVAPWMQACFGPEISADIPERNHRFIEESLELVQAGGATRSECHQLVDYVYGRPAGEPGQEVGGVMVTLAALCLARGIDMHECGERELARVWTCVEKIRAKQAAKPKHSPLPEHVEPPVVQCPKREDRQHCEHWQDGAACCDCGATAMAPTDMRAQGMTKPYGWYSPVERRFLLNEPNLAWKAEGRIHDGYKMVPLYAGDAPKMAMPGMLTIQLGEALESCHSAHGLSESATKALIAYRAWLNEASPPKGRLLRPHVKGCPWERSEPCTCGAASESGERKHG